MSVIVRGLFPMLTEMSLVISGDDENQYGHHDCIAGRQQDPMIAGSRVHTTLPACLYVKQLNCKNGSEPINVKCIVYILYGYMIQYTFGWLWE